MAINFAAANTAGLNNPGTEIITLVKDGSGSFINPPSYDKMRAYLSSGEVPMLFVTAEGGETGSLYQLVEYSETENKIRFSNDATAIEFSAGSVAPVVSDVGGGGSGAEYMDKVNPTGTGAFSLNRKADTTIGKYSFAACRDTTASGQASHAEGAGTTASGYSSHAEGTSTTASSQGSHAEGVDAVASAFAAHAEGLGTTVSGMYSHAEGFRTTASGETSHAEGLGTKASSTYQHVHGKYNIEDTSNTYAEIVGNGTEHENSNAHTLDWSGNAWYAGTVEGKALILPSSAAGSTKKFKITVDDSGTISATEVT